MQRTELDTATLASRGWLALTPPEFRQEVGSRLTVKKFEKGETVYRLHDPPGGIWVILDGAVEFEAMTLNEAPSLMHFGWSGFWFGEGPLVTGHRRRTGARARTDATLATLSLPDCREILLDEPRFWQWIALLTVLKRHTTINWTTELLWKAPRRRVAAALLRLSGQSWEHIASPSGTVLAVTQQEIGVVASLSRTVINSVLREFQRDQLIRMRYREVQVLSADGLREVLAAET